MTDLHHITAYLVFVTMLPVIYMAGRLVFTSSNPTRLWLLMMLLVSGAYGWRTFYWDLLRSWLPVKWWDKLYGAAGFEPNAFWNVCVIVGNVSALVCVYYTVPRAQRHLYRWYTAWIWPRSPVLRPYLKKKFTALVCAPIIGAWRKVRGN